MRCKYQSFPYHGSGWLVAGLSPWMPRFESGSFHVRFLMGIVALREVFLKAFKLSPDGMIPLIIRTRLYLNTAGQVGETWRPSNQVMLFGISAGRQMFMLIATSHGLTLPALGLTFFSLADSLSARLVEHLKTVMWKMLISYLFWHGFRSA